MHAHARAHTHTHTHTAGSVSLEIPSTPFRDALENIFALELRFSIGSILPPRGHLALSGDVAGCHNQADFGVQGGAGACRVESRNDNIHPTMHSKKDPAPKTPLLSWRN